MRFLISTRRYSTVFKRILEQYATGSYAIIDGKRYDGSEFPKLIATWCTNACIRRTRDFVLIRDKEELFYFHDTPDDLSVAESEGAFVDQLLADRVARIRRLRKAGSVLSAPIARPFVYFWAMAKRVFFKG